MNNNNPNVADAPVPSPGTEQAAEQARQEQQPHREPGALDSVSGVVETIVDTARLVGDVVSIFA
jgi:hypothetical protein